MGKLKEFSDSLNRFIESMIRSRITVPETSKPNFDCSFTRKDFDAAFEIMENAWKKAGVIPKEEGMIADSTKARSGEILTSTKYADGWKCPRCSEVVPWGQIHECFPDGFPGEELPPQISDEGCRTCPLAPGCRNAKVPSCYSPQCRGYTYKG